MRKGVGIGAMAVLAAGCTTAPPNPLTFAPVSMSGLERVMGHDAHSLVAMFGEPDLDIREAQARKLQFVGPICVLDAYLYPKSGSEPVVGYIDARQPDGRDIDRASCVAALIANKR